MELMPLETTVLDKLCDGDHPLLIALRRQLPHIEVRRREFTGTGFYAEFDVAEEAEPAPVGKERLVFGDVEASVDGLQYGAGFLLYVDNGLLRMLEGYSYEEPWPERVTNFTLRFSDPKREAVLAKLSAVT